VCLLLRTWPQDWEARKTGTDCPFCSEGRIDRNHYGIRIFEGTVADGYLQRFAPLPGYTIVVWRGRHISDPADLTDDEACAYESEVLTVARALQRHFDPAQTNYLTLGNQIPHLHTNVVLRYVDDPSPGGTIELNSGTRITDEVLERQAAALRELLR
jgi:diadenosine tetraphosphate (Ap4A) HIT family hydrolase